MKQQDLFFFFFFFSHKSSHVSSSSTHENSHVHGELNFVCGAGTHLLQVYSHCCRGVHCP